MRLLPDLATRPRKAPAEVEERPDGAGATPRSLRRSDAGRVALSVRNLSTVYEDRQSTVHAVRDVSFDLRATERLGIVGESGSGKSALALSILGLIEPPGRVVGGEIQLGDARSRAVRPRARRRCVARRSRSCCRIRRPRSTRSRRSASRSWRRSLCTSRACGRSAARKRAADLLREVEISQAERRLDDYPHQYSGGMRQRVAIAIAIANNPNVLIADEPTTALDVTTQSQVLALLDRLVEEHRTAVILITHNLGIVSDFCDSVAVMYAGAWSRPPAWTTSSCAPPIPTARRC